jgi:hypothetical protein
MTETNSTQAMHFGELKVCTKCKTAKQRTEFHIGKEYPDGRKATCKDCMQAQRRAKYHSQRSEEISKRRARKASPEWKALLPERKEKYKAAVLERAKSAGPSATRQCTACAQNFPASDAYFNNSASGKFGLASKCRKCVISAYNADLEKNRAYGREKARVSYSGNADKIRAQYRDKRRTDPGYNLRMRVSCSVRQSLGTGRLGKSWTTLLGFTAQELKGHLEKQFTEGMTWERFLAGEIHLDHIIPVSFFNPPSAESLEFKMCWNLKNLQPLWALDNLSKSDTLPANFTELWNELYYEATRYAA